MKNNEIMISAAFQYGKTNEEYTLLVLKDITLKALIEAIYYGIGKTNENTAKFLEQYLRTRKEIQVRYNAVGDTNVIDFTKKDEKGTPVFEKNLDALGIVTSSCLFFSDKTAVIPSPLFDKDADSYILQEGNSLEYNISTRRLNVIEPSVIDILSPGDMPKEESASFWDFVIPPVLSAGGMIVARLIIMKVSPASASMGSTMILMSGAMAVVALVTSFYNYFKKKRENKTNVADWKENYENYIGRVIKTIKEWQVSDIKYLNSVYPELGKLFERTAKIDGSIFSRSQNDNDFMRISLGFSDEVKPLFEIKNERKDNIFNDIYYKKRGDTIEIRLPEKKRHLGRIQLLGKKNAKSLRTPEEQARENKNLFLLTDLPYVFANKGVDDEDPSEIVGFNYLRSDDNSQPPLLLDLKSCGALGVVSKDQQTSLAFIQHIVFELAYYHSPEDLQFVFFLNREDDAEKQNQLLGNYRYLPHANELLDGVSQFVFDKNSAGIVFGQLSSIMNDRVKEKSEEKDGESSSEKLTQIVCIVFDDYEIKKTGFSKFLPEVPKEGEPYVNANGLTFIFVQSTKDKLPKYCGNIVEIDKDNPAERKCSLRYNVLSRETLNVLSEKTNSSEGSSDKYKANDTDKLIEYKHFQNNYIFNNNQHQDAFRLAFRQLSAIYYTRIAENGKVPSMVSLFQLYQITSSDQVKGKILENWRQEKKGAYDITRNLCVPIGENEHGPVNLDLYEKADGPHMLVAGTTGSGKSETIITYLIGLCMKFTPEDLNLMLVDMKGGGFSDRLGKLPHCVGVVTDTAGEDEGTSATYMLKRFLESLNAEIKRRKLMLSRLGVDNVDSYIRATRSIKQIKEMEQSGASKEAIESIRKKLNEKQQAILDDVQEELSPLSHLVLVVDEFTELKRFSNESDDVDFIAEITTIARVGRTLGFHIVLVSQNIEGAITDDIRVNSKARICLKVATKQASKEMIGSTVAAAPTMPLNGRAYLLVGTGSRFEYFQSAFTGANRNTSIGEPVRAVLVPNSGAHKKGFYYSRKDNLIEIKKNEAISEHDTQLACVVNTIIALCENDAKPHQVFLPPLPGQIVDTTEWRQ